MTRIVGGGIEELRARLTGTVVAPADPDYDEARKVWNADIDRRPAVIARCLSAADVSAAIGFARREGLEIAVRGGAHHAAGLGTVDDGIVLDLSGMNNVTVDPATKRARVGGGALLGDLDAAAQAHGLAVPVGLISHTGVAGLTLGGGMGWLTRLHGLSIDNLVSAEIVTADGEIRRASATEDPDLFWAIRGGGGNFGVVTEFEFRLHAAGPLVHFGLLFWSLDDGPAMVRAAREVIPELPPSVNVVIAALNAPPAPFVPEQHHFRPGYALAVTGFGDPAEHADALARLREEVPPLFEFATPMPYVEVQQLLDEAGAWGNHSYEKGCYTEHMSDDAIEVLDDHMRRKTSPLSMILFYRLDGGYSAVSEDDTAFGGGRSPRYVAFILGIAPAAEGLPAEREWVRGLWDALQPHVLGNGYVNGMPEFDRDRVAATYGGKYQRLREIKRRYDPDNVFHRNANILPA
ncbi:MAG TPA: FAD-binding oxidoreductase [Amycolatopsis sp.]|nr:FAD-binding oxidoreductase [Amycolatopsis sp.]